MRRVLLLNVTYEPLTTVGLRRAVCLVLGDKAEVVHDDAGGTLLRSTSVVLAMPSVIRLRRYVRVPHRSRIPLTRGALMRRDNYMCAYCSRRAETIDHVVPRSRGGLHTWENYPISFVLDGLGSFDSLRIEILDPTGDGDDGLDPAAQPSYIPVGFSTSNDLDGFSFAQDGGLERSAKWAAGSATVVANERTNAGDILLFSGLSATDSAVVRFGLRDSAGDRGFLLRFSALGDGSPIANPEPASMALMGSGLVGLIGMYRRRRRTGASARPESA